VFSRDAIVGMAENHCRNRIPHTEALESRRKAATEAVPTVPLNANSLERFSHLAAVKEDGAIHPIIFSTLTTQLFLLSVKVAYNHRSRRSFILICISELRSAKVMWARFLRLVRTHSDLLERAF
jgi:hypothetical protein